MELKQLLLAEHSKAQTNKIIRFVGNNNKRFTELAQLFLSKEALIKQRAGWALSYCVMEHPELARPFMSRFIHHLKQENLHDAVKRNTLRLLQFCDIPENDQALLLEICYRYILSKNEAAAIKAFALTVAYRICETHPELLKELMLLPFSCCAFEVQEYS